MKKLTLLIAAAAIVGFAGAASAHHKPDHNPPGHDRVCLLTFNDPDNVAGGANADIVKAQWLPRHAAENQAGKHDDRVTGDFFGPQWDEDLCNEFKHGEPG